MKLPLLISVPHAGLEIAEEVSSISVLSPEEIEADGDGGAAEIYRISHEVSRFVTTPIARAFVDMNRSEDDRRPDGVVKTHTCWNVTIYNSPLSEETVQKLLDRIYRPYHRKLTEYAKDVVLGVDCHTMAETAPPIAPDPGKTRPLVCLSNADGTCPTHWFKALAECFEAAFETSVSLNDPFKGGYIIRAHSSELPWVQLELSRSSIMSNTEKRERVIAAFKTWAMNNDR